MDCPQASEWWYGSSPGLERGPAGGAHEDTFCRAWSLKHGVCCQLCFMCPFLFCLISSFLSLSLTFCLVRAWFNQPGLPLSPHCCESVTNETAKHKALNCLVLQEVCQILQWLIRVCAVLELLQLLLGILK